MYTMLYNNFTILIAIYILLFVVQLTAEDEERRRRRRERNKIAATKCRLKKRERTTHLMQVSKPQRGRSSEFSIVSRYEIQK